MRRSFEEVYSKISEESEKELNAKYKEIRKKKSRRIFACIIICIIVFVLMAVLESKFSNRENNNSIIELVIVGIILLFLKGSIEENKKNKKIYKDRIIKRLVELSDDNLSYSEEIGITKEEYKMANFDNDFNKYRSEDFIQGKIRNNVDFKMSDVVVEKLEEYRDIDDELKQRIITKFSGVYGFVRCSNTIEKDIYITSNLNSNKYNNRRIEIDSLEFEKYYDCFSEDKITALKIFTPELIEKLVEFQKSQENIFEIKISEDMVYFRVHCDNFLEANCRENAVDEKLIKEHYDTLMYPIYILENLLNRIEEI